MAKVEMSLNEYNEMKEELDFLRRVVREITTPVPDSWSRDYYGSFRNSHSISAVPTDEVKTYLENQIASHTPEGYDPNECIFEASFSNPSVMTVSYKELEPAELDGSEDK